MAAGVAFDDWAASLENSCAVCQRDDEEAKECRTRWGCDTEQSDEDWQESGALALEPCIFCDGRDDNCPDCEGTNQIPIKRCPWKLIEPGHRQLVQLVNLVQFGLLPAPGGWLDQPAVFTQAWDLVMAEKGRIDAARAKKAADDARREQARMHQQRGV